MKTYKHILYEGFGGDWNILKHLPKGLLDIVTNLLKGIKKPESEEVSINDLDECVNINEGKFSKKMQSLIFEFLITAAITHICELLSKKKNINVDPKDQAAVGSVVNNTVKAFMGQKHSKNTWSFFGQFVTELERMDFILYDKNIIPSKMKKKLGI